VDMEPNTVALFVYDDAATFFELRQKAGNKITPAKSYIYVQCNKMGSFNDHIASANELTGNNYLIVSNGLNLEHDATYANFGGPLYEAEVNEYMYQLEDNPALDFFADADGDYTLSTVIRIHTIGGSYRDFFAKREDGTNYWQAIVKTSGELALRCNTAGVIASIESTIQITNNTWYWIVFTKRGNNIGIYLDGTQVAFGTLATNHSYTGGFYVGQNGANSDYLYGRYEELYVGANNIFGATPNVGLTDTIASVGAKYMDVVL